VTRWKWFAERTLEENIFLARGRRVGGRKRRSNSLHKYERSRGVGLAGRPSGSFATVRGRSERSMLSIPRRDHATRRDASSRFIGGGSPSAPKHPA